MLEFFNSLLLCISVEQKLFINVLVGWKGMNLGRLDEMFSTPTRLLQNLTFAPDIPGYLLNAALVSDIAVHYQLGARSRHPVCRVSSQRNLVVGDFAAGYEPVNICQLLDKRKEYLFIRFSSFISGPGCDFSKWILLSLFWGSSSCLIFRLELSLLTITCRMAYR